MINPWVVLSVTKSFVESIVSVQFSVILGYFSSYCINLHLLLQLKLLNLNFPIQLTAAKAQAVTTNPILIAKESRLCLHLKSQQQFMATTRIKVITTSTMKACGIR